MIVICIKQHLSNIWSSIHEKVKQHWGWFQKRRYKKVCILLAPIMKAYLIHFLFRREFEVIFAWIVKKSVFLVQISWILKLWFEDWPFKRIFTRVHLLFKKRHVSDCQKEISFVQITHLKFTFLTPCDIKSYY